MLYVSLFFGSSKADSNRLLKNSVGIYKIHIKETNIKNTVYNYYFDILAKARKLETKNISVDERNYKNLVIYFARYDHWKSIKLLYLY